MGREVEEIAGYDDDVELGRGTQEPVILLERVVEIGHEQALHCHSTLGHLAPTAGGH
jgi:hypothetical protein